ncbi:MULTISPECIES: hypothetical protein [Francisella]|uniref:Uncharacterized protein n=1 Tax=Francisella opportunistica TaxID=2016517 RepID=A0A345JTK3_9GAMM|nr:MULTISPECIES: hypothetical protein [Francisella]APC92448.1 Pathogenicity determinant protein C [Francisella sp. MA067296]AXH30649.1 hypothetical protein CGC43_08735 [Francisella opportunistica]AXH32289.1 hypothetical protein CGC44_08705 [Francisella opportunistica]AXH33938.1 hypothetical protein CGC45_08765 [Francisella opportunistica]
MDIKKTLNINFEEVSLPTKLSEFTNKSDKKSLGGSNLYILTLSGKSFLTASSKLLNPSESFMEHIENIRNKEKAYIIIVLSLDEIVDKIKFVTFGHKSVIFDFKKIWGLVDFIAVHTNDKNWVHHKFTSFIPSITYANQNILNLPYHSDFLYIYHTPEYYNLNRENARNLVAKIPNPFWVRGDQKENKFNFNENLSDIEIKNLKDKIDKIKKF